MWSPRASGIASPARSAMRACRVPDPTEADQAALRKSCDWGYADPTMKNLKDLPLDEIQLMREIAQLLSVRFRLELSENIIGPR